MSYNQVTFNNLIHGKRPVAVADPADIFIPERMEPYLREAEEVDFKIYTWDDITDIHVTHLDLKTIHRLPTSLEDLYIQNTTLEHLIIPQDCTAIKHINITYSNLSEMPDVSHLRNMTQCAITYSNLSRIPMTAKQWPQSLTTLNLNANSFTSYNLNISTQLPINRWRCEIQLSHNMLNIERGAYRSQENIIFGSQNTYVHVPVTTESIERSIAMEHLRRNHGGPTNNANEYVKNLRRDKHRPINDEHTRAHIQQWIQAPHPGVFTAQLPRPQNIAEQAAFDALLHAQINDPVEYRIRPPPPPPPITQPLAGTQTVHASSVCDSVTKSVVKIKELTRATYNAALQPTLIDDFITAAYKTAPADAGFIKRILCYLKLFTLSNSPSISQVRIYVQITDQHSSTQTTYGELLARVWLLARDHPQRADFLTNIKYEIADSNGYCFTGRFNRLVNSLIGFVDGVTVGISVKEQLQLEMGKLIASLGKGDITYDKCMSEFTALFDDPVVAADPSITKTYRESWLFALEDYKPEPETAEDEAEAVPLLLPHAENSNP